MSDKAGATPIELISANIVNTRFEDLDKATVDLAKNRIIDVIGCAIGGANDPGNPELVDLVRDWGGKEEATIIVHGGKVPAHHAALINGVMARSNDFEVMSFVHRGIGLPSHNAGSTVPTALAAAEACGSSGKELLTALIAGDDVVIRVSVASDWDFYQGFDAVGSLVPWGTTAVAGRLFGLDEVQIRNAFGLALNMTAGSIQNIWDGVHAFKLIQGTPAKDGIFAAELAKKGWTGVQDPLFARFGYFKLYNKGFKTPEVLTDDLGKVYYGECMFKAYPCGRPNHTPIDCARALVSQYQIKAEDIEEVTIYLTPQSLKSYYAKPYSIRVFPHGDAVFSFQFTTATALLYGDVRVEHFTEAAIRDARVNELIKKIKLEEIQDKKVGAEVKVKMKDGKVYSEYRATPKADPLTNPLPQEEILAKFRHQVKFSQTVSRENGEKIISMVQRLEELENINELMRLVVK